MSVITETYTKDKQLSKNFMLSEFLCKDGTKTVKYSPEFVNMLQQIIDKSGLITSGKVISGYRTPAYSVKVGGTKNDAHTVGIAADMQFKDKNKNIIPPKYIACLAQDLGFGGIGIMKNSIHLDARQLGGYSNKKWWGDETKDYSLSKNGKDFYKYYGLTKDEVYKYLQIGTTQSTAKVETPKVVEASKVEEPVVEEPKVVEQPKVEESTPVLVVETPIVEPVVEEPKVEESIPQTEETEVEDQKEVSNKGILETLRELLRQILKWISGDK